MDEKFLVKYVSSFVLGDGALSYVGEGKRNSKYYIKQVSQHKDYIDFQKDIIENITSTRLDYNEPYVDNRDYSCQAQYSLSSMCHPFFTAMRERFYFENKKQIDPHYIKLWDDQTMAFFYMDNGWIECQEQSKGNIYVRVGLATHAFSYGDVVLIRDFIKEKMGIPFDIKRHKQKSGEYKFYLRNSKDNAKMFLDKIKKYCFPSFDYKFSFERFTPYKTYVPKCKGGDIV